MGFVIGLYAAASEPGWKEAHFIRKPNYSWCGVCPAAGGLHDFLTRHGR